MGNQPVKFCNDKYSYVKARYMNSLNSGDSRSTAFVNYTTSIPSGFAKEQTGVFSSSYVSRHSPDKEPSAAGRDDRDINIVLNKNLCSQPSKPRHEHALSTAICSVKDQSQRKPEPGEGASPAETACKSLEEPAVGGKLVLSLSDLLAKANARKSGSK